MNFLEINNWLILKTAPDALLPDLWFRVFSFAESIWIFLILAEKTDQR